MRREHQTKAANEESRRLWMRSIRCDRRRFCGVGLLFLLALFLGASCAWAENKDFSIVVLPAPQFYAAKFPDIGLAQTEWICKNVEKLQIKFVTTAGDNVDAGYIDEQYANSRRFM